MKRVSILVLLVATGMAVAAPGDQWILPLERQNLQGDGWTEYAGAGYGGASAWEGAGGNGVRRAYWKTDGTTMPASTELYTIEFFAPTSGAGNWQPLESQFNGSAGETFPIEPGIPWVGAFGTNHQYSGGDFNAGNAGTWRPANGNHLPASADFNAANGGDYFWLKNGSWLYAKWDFPWDITRSWSALRLTQITPEPASALLLLLGAPLLRRKSR